MRGFAHARLRSSRRYQFASTHTPLRSAFLWFIFSILQGNPKKELLRGLWLEHSDLKLLLSHRVPRGPPTSLSPALMLQCLYLPLRVQVLLIMGLWGLFGYQNPGSKYSLLWDFGAFLGTKTQGPSTPYYGTLGPFGYQNPGSKYSLLWDFGAFLGTKTHKSGLLGPLGFKYSLLWDSGAF